MYSALDFVAHGTTTRTQLTQVCIYANNLYLHNTASSDAKRHRRACTFFPHLFVLGICIHASLPDAQRKKRGKKKKSASASEKEN